MDYLAKLINQTKLKLFFSIFSCALLIILAWYIINYYVKLNKLELLGSLIVWAFILSLIFAIRLSNYLMQPLKNIWLAIMHLAPKTTGIVPPDTDSIKFGKEVVVNLIDQLYEMLSVTNSLKGEEAEKVNSLTQNFIAQSLPLPLFVLDDSETIKFANQAAASYIGSSEKEMIGKNVYMLLDMSFPSEDTFDNWLKKSKDSSATSTQTWERVRLEVRENHPLLMFDLAAYYNQGNPDKIETLLVMFDHTKLYSQEDQAVSFMALSVHELRSPLTLLRGYIEVLEDELGEKVDDELKGFIEKMHAQADLLTAYVNNILNVTRVDDDQLELKLAESDWATVLFASIESMRLRAKVRGITLNCKVAENLPKVGVDRLSIQEVINNLIDNAIKYSGKSKEINIDSHLTENGLIETTVEDHGLGIASSVMSNLFTKFYRDHNNRSQVGGTGLGLYLSKAIVKAHGGNLWVKSHEGQGSVFGFSVLPYSALSEEAKKNEDKEITRSAHGWIKNHSLYRR